MLGGELLDVSFNTTEQKSFYLTACTSVNSGFFTVISERIFTVFQKWFLGGNGKNTFKQKCKENDNSVPSNEYKTFIHLVIVEIQRLWFLLSDTEMFAVKFNKRNSLASSRVAEVHLHPGELNNECNQSTWKDKSSPNYNFWRLNLW